MSESEQGIFEQWKLTVRTKVWPGPVRGASQAVGSKELFQSPEGQLRACTAIHRAHLRQGPSVQSLLLGFTVFFWI